MTNLATLLPARRNRTGEATSARILEAAELEFAAKGFDGARLAAIARGATVQQALIHHYFADKAGLFQAVIDRALTSIGEMSVRILEEMTAPKRGAKGKRLGRAGLEALMESMVGVLVDFYVTHARVLRILRHEALRGGPFGEALLHQHVKPQLDAVVAKFDGMRRRGEIRADVDARHLCISAVAMACFPHMEELFLGAIWEVDPDAPEFIAKRKKEIVQTLLARMTP